MDGRFVIYSKVTLPFWALLSPPSLSLYLWYIIWYRLKGSDTPAIQPRLMNFINSITLNTRLIPVMKKIHISTRIGNNNNNNDWIHVALIVEVILGYLDQIYRSWWKQHTSNVISSTYSIWYTRDFNYFRLNKSPAHAHTHAQPPRSMHKRSATVRYIIRCAPLRAEITIAQESAREKWWCDVHTKTAMSETITSHFPHSLPMRR